MSELVTDEIVDVLARRQYAAMVRVDKYPGNAPTWEGFGGPFKEQILVGARAELEALAPLIAARALSEAATWFRQQGYERDLTASLALDAMRTKLGTHGTMKEG